MEHFKKHYFLPFPSNTPTSTPIHDVTMQAYSNVISQEKTLLSDQLSFEMRSSHLFNYSCLMMALCPDVHETLQSHAIPHSPACWAYLDSVFSLMLPHTQGRYSINIKVLPCLSVSLASKLWCRCRLLHIKPTRFSCNHLDDVQFHSMVTLAHVDVLGSFWDYTTGSPVFSDPLLSIKWPGSISLICWLKESTFHNFF